jgi:hypothetical protein
MRLLSGSRALRLGPLGLLVVGVTLPVATPTASAKPKPPQPSFTVAVSPASLAAGSSGNALTFRFSATETSRGQVSLEIPAVPEFWFSVEQWTTPQSSNPAGTGYVRASKQTCNSASVASITGVAPGPWTVVVDAKCAKGKSFLLTYGAGDSLTATKRAGEYTFTAMAQAGEALLPLAAQPVVTVAPGPTTQLFTDLGGGSHGSAILGQGRRITVVVSAWDQYQNTVTSDNGSVTQTFFQQNFDVSNVEVSSTLKEITANLENGTGTFSFDYTLSQALVKVRVLQATRPGIFSGDSSFLISTTPVLPNLDAARLDVAPTPNPDGTLTGTLSILSTGMNLDTRTLLVKAPPIQIPGDLVKFPILATTVGGDLITATAVITTAMNPQTLESTGTTLAAGKPWAVFGWVPSADQCSYVTVSFSGGLLPVPCPSTFLDVNVVSLNTAFVQDPEDPGSLAPLFDIQDPACADPLTTWDGEGCVPLP